MATLLVGDVVCLAGTPMKMVVAHVRGLHAHCQWIDCENQLNEYPFQIPILEKQQPNNAPPFFKGLPKGRSND